jgi:peptidoglycan/xylan/chitin deacetylase (PgdA/CDA1 family)
MRLARRLVHHFSPGGAKGALSILIFHRVLPQRDPLFPETPDADAFNGLLTWIGSAFSVLQLEDAIEALSSSGLPARALAITFDDGYADNAAVAMPILRKHGMPATFFIASSFIDGGRMWNDTVIESIRRTRDTRIDLSSLGLGEHAVGSTAARRATIDRLLPLIKYLPPAERERAVKGIAEVCGATLPDDLMLSSSGLRALRGAGMSIGGHTGSHPILSRVDDATAREEIVAGKARLEAVLGEQIRLFAYPNGRPGVDYDARHTAMVREAGYVAAVTTSPGAARKSSDVFQLPRFTPWDRTPLRFGLRLVNNLRFAGEVV